MIRLEDWTVFGGTIEIENLDMQVDHVDVDLIVRDTTSRDEENAEVPFYFTDVQFQPGFQKTGWIPETREMMDRIEFDVDEQRNYMWTDPDTGEYVADPYFIFESVQPSTYTSAELDHTRRFNLMGRGHEVVVLPNDLPEEKFWALNQIAEQGLERPVEILSTGVDFTIKPKNDYDLVRISTDSGALLPEENFPYRSLIEEYQDDDPETVQSILVDHPLNMRYSREFWFGAGQKGDTLEIHASTMTVRKNGAQINPNGIKSINADGTTIPIYKNKFHLIPRGSVRFRFEFYKIQNVDIAGNMIPVLMDAGIGFGGMVEFKQWTYGKERI